MEDFYIRDLYQAVRGASRGRFISGVLLVARVVLIVAAMTSSVAEYHARSIYDSFVISSELHTKILLCFFSIECAIVFMLVAVMLSKVDFLRLFLRSTQAVVVVSAAGKNNRKVQQNHQKQPAKHTSSSSSSSASSRHKQRGRLNYPSPLRKVFSFSLSVFKYILFVPSLTASIVQIFNSASPVIPILNFFLCLLLASLHADCDYNYLIYSKDCLARPFSSLSFLSIALEIALVVASQISRVHKDAFLLLLFIGDIFFILKRPFYQKPSQLLALSSGLYCVATGAVIFIMGLKSDHSFNVSMFLKLIYLINIPLAFAAASRIFTQRRTAQNLLSRLASKQPLSAAEIDVVMRERIFTLASACWKAKFISERSAELTILHSLAWVNQSSSTAAENHTATDQSISLEDFRQTIQDFSHNTALGQLPTETSRIDVSRLLLLALKQFIESTNLKQRNIFCDHNAIVKLVFLLERMRQPKQFWIEYYRTLNASAALSATKKTRQIIASIEVSESFTAQSPSSFIEVIRFEKNLEYAFHEIAHLTQTKVSLLQMLMRRLINLEELTTLGSEYIQGLEVICTDLKNLSATNSSHRELQALQVFFLEGLATQVKAAQINFDVKNTETSSQHGAAGGAAARQIAKIFNGKSCVISTVYQQSGALTIQHVSKNFARIFGGGASRNNGDFEAKVEGKSIEMIIPGFLHSAHARYVQRYVECLSSSSPNEAANQMVERPIDSLNSVFFGLTLSRMIVPIRIRLQMTTLLYANTLGICAEITPFRSASEQSYEYLLCDAETYAFIGATQKISSILHTDALSSTRSQSNLSMKIPLLRCLTGSLLNLPDDVRHEVQLLQSGQFVTVLFFQPPAAATGQKGKSTAAVEKRDMKKSTWTTISIGGEKQRMQSESMFQTARMHETILLITFKVRYMDYQNARRVAVVEVQHVRQASRQHNLSSVKQLMNSYMYLRQRFNMNSSAQQHHASAAINTMTEFAEQILNSSCEGTNSIGRISIDCSDNHSPKQQHSQREDIDINDHTHLNDDTTAEVATAAAAAGTVTAPAQHNESSITTGFIIERSAIHISSFAATAGGGGGDHKNDDHLNISSTLQQLLKIPSPPPPPPHTVNHNASFQDQSSHLLSQTARVSHQFLAASPPSKIQLSMPFAISDTLPQNNRNTIQGLLNDTEGPWNQQQWQHQHLQQKSQILLSPTALTTTFEGYNFQENLGMTTSSPSNQKMLSRSPTSPFKAFSNQHDYLQSSMSSTGGKAETDDKQSSLRKKASDIRRSTKLLNSKQQLNLPTSKYQQEPLPPQHSPQPLLLHSQLQDNIVKQRKDRNEERKKPKQPAQQNFNDFASSTGSKQSGQKQARSLLSQIISDRNTPLVIKSSIFTGFLSFSAILLITNLQQTNLTTTITDQKKNKDYSTWPTDFQASVNSLVKCNNILLLMKTTDFAFASPAQKTDFATRINNQLFNKKDVVINLISQSSGVQASRLVFQLLKRQTNTFQFGQYFDPLNIIGASSVPAKYVFYSIDYLTSIHYSIILSFQHTFRYAVGLGTGRPEYYMILNNLNFHDILTSVQQQLLSLQITSDASLQSQLTVVMIFIISISALCLSIVLPLYAYVQRAREQVLSLLATFSFAALTEMLQSLENEYDTAAIQLNRTFHVQFEDRSYKKQDEHKNTKSISQTTRLPRYSITLIFALFLTFLLVIIHPISNQLLSVTYLDEESLSLKTASKDGRTSVEQPAHLACLPLKLTCTS